MRERLTNAVYSKGLFTFDNQTELPLSAARVLNVRYQAFRASAWRKSAKSLRRE
jgi:hypothetical protein